MIVLAGADLVLPDRIVAGGSLLVDGERIAKIEPRAVAAPVGAVRLDLSQCVVVPGFIDVHVHGVQGIDVLDGGPAVLDVASRLPEYGVTAFCPTSVACDPATLRGLLGSIQNVRARSNGAVARVLPAHLESNFINPDYRGAQPLECLRVPGASVNDGAFTGNEIIDIIVAHRHEVGIVTLAPELDGVSELLRTLVDHGHIVSIGHTAATYEETVAAIEAGVTHATHLFNRMTPMTHRAPGVPGAVLQSDNVIAELICDGFHVHPALVQIAIRAKGLDGVLAITDGTAGSGLPLGSVTHLGSRSIVVTDKTAVLEDGTLAGSVLTMDGAFRMLVNRLGLSLVEAARLCATTPARQLKLAGTGKLEVGAVADLAVLDKDLNVRYTFIAGQQWRNRPSDQLV